MAVKAGAVVMWGHLKDELYHYKLGSKLLWRDVQTSRQLLNRVFSGNTLSRRERQQLLKTSADMFRLVRSRSLTFVCWARACVLACFSPCFRLLVDINMFRSHFWSSSLCLSWSSRCRSS